MAPTRAADRKSSPIPMTSPQKSPIKKRKNGITVAQKQALIDNLQLEITERARRLRAQYNIQAQQLRSRVEMRINRIPTSLRKKTMGDLLHKSQQPPQSQQSQSSYEAKPPPVPAKDGTSPQQIHRKPVPTSTMRGKKRPSEEMSGADKENQAEIVDVPKKKLRGAPTKEVGPIFPGQVLSPTSSNAKVLPRDRSTSPMKSVTGRPASPVKASPVKAPAPKSSSNLLSTMVEKAKSTRPDAVARTNTTSSAATSSVEPASKATGRTKKAAGPPPPAAATRGKRKVSGNSDSSDASSATVVKNTTASRATKNTASANKKTVMSSIKSATTKKAPASKAAAAPAATGRTLRKRA
ncbi:Borealin N terminal-domain-containing protein [Xylariomycetidae sp. FL0641]|nr:Borealin N terminal-domain-containing protein [Xylariomycetidae sp. FL0641]KAI0025339.1 Borealin N terminal-domain-containing protein [Xylariomycetidae sp. FL0641]